MSVSFTGLSPAANLDGAAWFTDAMAGRQGVALVVPKGFAAYARLLHPLRDGDRWGEVAPEYLGRGGTYAYPFTERVASATSGDLGVETVDAIVPLLASATTTPSVCHFGLWHGWGDLHPGSRAILLPSGHFGPIQRRWMRWQMRGRQRNQDAPVHAFLGDCAVQPWWILAPSRRIHELGALPLHRLGVVGKGVIEIIGMEEVLAVADHDACSGTGRGVDCASVDRRGERDNVSCECCAGAGGKAVETKP